MIYLVYHQILIITELILKLKNSPHSRIPVWDKHPENIVGVLYVRKLIGLKKISIQKKFDIK